MQIDYKAHSYIDFELKMEKISKILSISRLYYFVNTSYRIIFGVFSRMVLLKCMCSEEKAYNKSCLRMPRFTVSIFSP